MIKAKDIFELGAEPVDISAARLLWKSPWWAKVLESKQQVPFNEVNFIRALGRLYRDFKATQGGKLPLEQFADLATMARKIRWKNADGPGFGTAFIGRLRKKLSYLKWNETLNRFEFEVPPKRLGPELRDWRTLGKKGKRRQAAMLRAWRKEHREERLTAESERQQKVDKSLREALGAPK